jgi:hypothetical protein
VNVGDGVCIERRPIPGWPYEISSHPDEPEVWRVPGLVPGKGGSMRRIAARRITPAKRDGRVSLSRPGEKRSFHPLRDLYPLSFPDLVKQRRREALERQAVCRKGHPLIEPLDPEVFRCLAPRMFGGSPEPKITPKFRYWGTNNRICRWCAPAPERSVNYIYSPEYGIYRGAVSSAPAEPVPRVVLPIELLNSYGLYTDNEVAAELNTGIPFRWQINSSECL